MVAVYNLILRVENCSICPSPGEMEQVADPSYGIWIKDYDVFGTEDEESLLALINDALRLAAKINVGEKFIHLGVQEDNGLMRFSPDFLRTVSEAGCVLEISFDSGER